MGGLPESARAYARYKFIKVEVLHGPYGDRTRRMYEATYYNCWGKVLWKTHVFMWDGEKLPRGTAVDLRTLELTAAGCCPPALTNNFIMGEGGEMVERDPVVEAMKLHKRGYFGGGD